jgi:ATP-dependent DNA helicase 2 subunit 2
MADKEATVFVIDLGASMDEKSQGRETNNLEWSMKYMWSKITAKVPNPSFVAAGKRTDR